MLISLIIFVILSILAAYFASNNLVPITLNLLGYPLKGTSGLIVVTAFGGGIILGILMMVPAVVSRGWSEMRHRRRLQDYLDHQAKPTIKAPVDEEAEEE